MDDSSRLLLPPRLGPSPPFLFGFSLAGYRFSASPNCTCVSVRLWGDTRSATLGLRRRSFLSSAHQQRKRKYVD